MPPKNDVLAAVLAELGTAGAQIVSIDQNKHIKIDYALNGSLRTVIAPATPSDWRAPLNVRAEIRRALRARQLPDEL